MIYQLIENFSNQPSSLDESFYIWSIFLNDMAIYIYIYIKYVAI
jgi:hypothetical protein